MQPKTLSDILKKNEALSILVNAKNTMKEVAVIALLNDLSAHDKEALGKMRHLIIDLDDDLVKKLIELHNENEQLKSLALIDSLTGLFNNRFFFKNLEIEMARTKRTGLPCSLMIIDLDNFKLLNDTFGHIEGDKFLIKVGKVMLELVRPTDMACRYGGDEFAVIMPATELFDAIRVADRLMNAISYIPTPHGHVITSSIGIAEHRPMSAYKIDEFIHAADSAMYDAKKNGKNQVSYEGKGRGVKPRLDSVSFEEKAALSEGYSIIEKQGDENIV
jgi:diguanylate cyclase (GGDEF)-like protein